MSEVLELLKQANDYSIRLQMGEQWCARVDAILAASAEPIDTNDDLKATNGPLLELDGLLARFHEVVWESASHSLCAYDEAGTDEAKAIQRHVRVMIAASAGQAEPLRKSVRAAVAMLKNGEYAEHWANAEAPKDADAAALEEVITELVNGSHELIPRRDRVAPTPAAAQDGPKCRACNGNDGNLPCAYPEGHPHCLRNTATSPVRGAAREQELHTEIDRLNAIINTPQSGDFLRAVSIEAEHQRQRWGSKHDAGKEPADWFWLVGYLAGKALNSAKSGDNEKFEHHIITTAAALQNWHMQVFGQCDMRPGIYPPAEIDRRDLAEAK
jgi:hypothetical protein